MAPAEVNHTPNLSTNRRMKTQDEKYAHDLACDYIYFHKLGMESHKANTRVAAILRRVGGEVERRHEVLLKNMCERLHLRTANVEDTFRGVAEEIFSTEINWGRIVVLYCFAAEVAVFCSQNDINIIDDIVRWLAEYVSERKLNEWIRKSGGWVSEKLLIYESYSRKFTFMLNPVCCHINRFSTR